MDTKGVNIPPSFVFILMTSGFWGHQNWLSLPDITFSIVYLSAGCRWQDNAAVLGLLAPQTWAARVKHHHGWLCCLQLWSSSAWCRHNFPALSSISIPVHSQELQQHHYPLFPMESPENIFQLSQSYPPALPSQSRPQHILQCKVSVKHQQANTAETLFSHGWSGNDSMTCRNRFSACELQEWTQLSELPALVWAGLCSKPFYLHFFPSWQWRKQPKRNTVTTGWNLAHLICAGPSWAFWWRTVWAESAIWHSLMPEARSLFPYLKGQYISLYVWKLRPELGWHEEGTCSPGNAALRHDVCRIQRETRLL